MNGPKAAPRFSITLVLISTLQGRCCTRSNLARAADNDYAPVRMKLVQLVSSAAISKQFSSSRPWILPA